MFNLSLYLVVELGSEKFEHLCVVAMQLQWAQQVRFSSVNTFINNAFNKAWHVCCFGRHHKSFWIWIKIDLASYVCLPGGKPIQPNLEASRVNLPFPALAFARCCSSSCCCCALSCMAYCSNCFLSVGSASTICATCCACVEANCMMSCSAVPCKLPWAVGVSNETNVGRNT